MIGNIFRHASCVLAWVGEHADGSEELFNPWKDSKIPSGWIQPFYTFRDSADTSLSTKELSRRKKIMLSFIERPYWRRTWIVQEILIARKLVIHCGSDTMNWIDFVDRKWWCLYLRNFDERHLFNSCAPPRDWFFWKLVDHTSTTWSDGISILKLMVEFSYTESYDRRDRVYALLTLDRVRDKAIPSNYNVDFIEVFITVLDLRVDGGQGDLKEFWDLKGSAAHSFVHAFQINHEECQEAVSRLRARADGLFEPKGGAKRHLSQDRSGYLHRMLLMASEQHNTQCNKK